MERWVLVPRRHRGGPQFYIQNYHKTLIWLSPSSESFPIHRLMKKLEEVGFPLRYTNGIRRIDFRRLSIFGEYEDGHVWIDTRPHRMKTVVETIVHEIAHHLDDKHEISGKLTCERKKRGRFIHRRAARADDEYFARGMERFYSTSPADKARLRKENPRLYREILRLHRAYSQK